MWELIIGDIESSYEFFENTFLKTLNKFAPIRTGNVNQIKQIPWLSNSIKNLKIKRNKAHRQWESSPLEADLNTFKYLRAKLNALITKTNRNYYRDKFNQSIGDSRQVYILLIDIRGINNKSEMVPTLKDSNDTDLAASEIVEKFNMHFPNIGCEIQKNVQNSELKTFASEIQSMFLFEVTEKQISDLINSIDNKNSSDDNFICNVIVKTFNRELAPLLAALVNQSLKQGKFPSSLSRAKVFPLFKSGYKSDINNCRPISLLKVFSKVFEKAMYRRVHNYFEKFGFFYCKQYGFRAKHSTMNAVAALPKNLVQTIKEK